MKNNLGQLMQQAQKMQEEMKKMQEDLSNYEVEGEAGAGMVKVTMSGKHEVRDLTIDPELLKEDREMVQDLVSAAVNHAVSKVESLSKEKMSSMASDMGMPPGFQFPF